MIADDTLTLSWWTNTISVHCTLCNNTQHMHCNVWVLLTRQCMCAIDNCSVILGFGVQVNVLVVVFVHFKVFIGVKATF